MATSHNEQSVKSDCFDAFGDRTRAIFRRALWCGWRYGMAAGFMLGVIVGVVISHGW